MNLGHEIANRIDSVSADDIRRVASRLLASAPTLAGLGPVGRLDEYEAVKARLAS